MANIELTSVVNSSSIPLIERSVVASKVRVSTVVPSQLPTHFQSAETELTQLLKIYYQWMEIAGGVLDSSSKIDKNFYLDTSDAGFLKFFTKRIIPNIPQDALIDKKLLAKHARNFYQSKGSEASFKFLFQAMYGTPVDFYYPKQDLFRTSSAVWSGKNTLKVTSDSPYFSSIIGRKIHSSSGASIIVDSYTQSQFGNTRFYTLVVSKPQGYFDIDEIINTELVAGQNTVYCRPLGLVSHYKINAGGSGYVVGDPIVHAGGDGVDFIAIVETIDTLGAIQSIKITDSGVGFAQYAPVFISAGSGIGAQIQFFIGAMNSVNSFADDTDFLSSSKKLQDGEMWQEFSYVLKSAVNSTKYKGVVDDLVHPAGTRRFAQLITDGVGISDITQLEVTVEQTIDDLFSRLIGHIVKITHEPGINPISGVMDIIRTIRPESMTPVVSHVVGSMFFEILSLVKAYGESDGVIEPYSNHSLSQYANTQIQELIKRWCRTYVQVRLGDQFTEVPIIANADAPLVGISLIHTPQSSISGIPSGSILRALQPESLTPIGESLVDLKFITLVDTRSRGDTINLFDDEAISNYALTQIQNMYATPVVFTEVTTAPYP